MKTRWALLCLVAALSALPLGGCAVAGVTVDLPPAEAPSAPLATTVSVPTAMPTPVPSATPEPTAAPSPTPGPPLALLGSYPIDGDGAVLPDRPLVLAFERAVEPASLEAALSLSPAVEGRLEWLDDRQVAYYPDGGWATADSWTVHLDESVRAVDGGELLQAVTLTFSTQGRGVPLPILMYHHVAELPEDASEGLKDWTVSPEAFREQLAYLEEHGWTSISGAALNGYLLDGEPLPARAVVISVDDGNRSFYENGWPILRETSLRPLMFLVSQFADYGGYMNWDEVRELVAEGAWVGSHSYSHRSMREIDAGAYALEFGDSRTILETETGQSVDTYCYPYGARNEAGVEALAGYGYRTGYSLNPTYWQRPEDPFFLGRLRVDYRMTMDDFGALLP